MLSDELGERGLGELADFAHRVRRASSHLLGMINRIPDLARIEAGRMEMSVEKFDIEPVVRDAANTVWPLVQENGNRLEVRCPADTGAMISTPPSCARVC
jgi:signal transduction histidine kinase